MSKINCKVTKCLNNKYSSCTKTYIDVENITDDNAICKSYKEKMFNNYKTEFAYDDFPMLFEVNVSCMSTDCIHNKELKCNYGEIEISPLIEKITMPKTLGGIK